MERFKKLMEQIENEIETLSHDVQRMEDNPTPIRLDIMRKDVKRIRQKLTSFLSHLNSFRVW